MIRFFTATVASGEYSLPMRHARIALAVWLLAIGVAFAQNQTPTVDQLIGLKRVGSPAIAPNGQWVAFTLRDTNWDDNNYHTEIWLADVKTGDLRQLTSHAKKSSTSPVWSPDSSRLAFATDRDDKRQIYVIDPRGGEAHKLTAAEEGVGAFSWAPDGKSIAYTSTESKTDADKEREKKFGEFDVFGEGYRMSHLWVFDIASKKARRLTNGPFTVGAFSWSPDSTRIAFDHRVNPANTSGPTADISIVTVADGRVSKLVEQDGADGGPVWSPDGSRIAFGSAMKKEFSFLNNGIGVIPSSGGTIEYVTTALDENPSIVDWNRGGLFFSASQRTSSSLYSVDPATKAITKFAAASPQGKAVDPWIASGFSLTPDGQWATFTAADASTLSEIYVAQVSTTMKPRKLTSMSAQTSGWAAGPIEVVSWKSQDGATIEGVLHKPVGFQAGRKYPLLVVIHGGPTAVSRPTAYSSTSIYPIDIWTAKGALVLEPNYRGSAGYGEKFRSLNVRNLGVGDAWDVLSAIDHLIKEGMADPDRVGAMGWSQGGYISAYLATHDSARFKAISVGAGISNWMTYYVNTDITQFTRHYLKATPWDDPDIYAKTSPMTYIKGAKAPTLIQHGSSDQRVPTPNAYELYRGLQDVGVPSKLIIYKGFEGIGHGPSKPKSSRAVMQHNLEWFDKYIFGGSTTTTSQQEK
jgi:dipeptidyl aminopeptidase/acylaminoacyl peptidase